MSYTTVAIEHPTGHANFSNVTLPGITIYFSYATPIAFIRPGMGWVIRENDWGPTTGKHLNSIRSDKSFRIDGRTFESKLADALSYLER